MGLFSRKRDAQGLYTGDAPVTAPGVDGAAPTAYTALDPGASHATGPYGGTPVAPALVDVTNWDAAPDPGRDAADVGTPWQPGAQAGAVTVPPAPAPPETSPPEVQWAAQPQFAQPHPGQPSPAQPQFGQPSPAQPQFGQPPSAPAGFPAGQTLEAALAPYRSAAQQEFDLAAAIAAAQQRAALDPAATGRARKGLRGCLIGFLLVMLLVAGGIVFTVLKTTHVLDPIVGSSDPPTQVGAIGSPVTVTYDDATLELTVIGATAQPGNAWAFATRSDSPLLVVEVQMRRTDTGSDSVEVMGWDWSITPPGRAKVTGDIITEYKPDVASPELVAGDSVRGFLSFRTSATTGTLALGEFASRAPLVTWQLSAGKAAPVTGTIGKPAQGAVSRPGFTVTISGPRSIGPTDKRVLNKPKSGRYLLVDVRMVPLAGLDGYLGTVDADAFVFTPKGGKPVAGDATGVRDAMFAETVQGDRPVTGLLVFDAMATAGTLAMKDAAGRTVITWVVPGK